MAWDDNSGIRERLALLAAIGPTIQNASAWGYNPSRDLWYRCEAPTRRIPVRQEGSASLAIIWDKWRIDRTTAMAIIGHEEKP